MLRIMKSSRPQVPTALSSPYRASSTGRGCQEVGPPVLLSPPDAGVGAHLHS